MRVVSSGRPAHDLPLSGHFSAARHPDLVFWLCFALLNGLLFLPLYLSNWETSSFWPVQAGVEERAVAVARELFLWRNNADMFRLSLEVAILAALWVNVGWLWQSRGQQRVYRALFATAYFLAFIYAVYESVSLNLYQVDPVFYAQYRLVTDGVPFVIEHLRWPWPVFVIGAVLVVALSAVILGLIRGLIGGVPPVQLSRATRVLVVFLASWALLAPLISGVPLASPKSAVASLAAKVAQNISESLALRHTIDAYDSRLPQQVYDYSGTKLLHKPDVYLIFVESYGSVLYKRSDWRRAYEALLDVLQHDLAGQGWHMATALSESPTWGGGSWMAYTSALFGLRIDNHTAYLSLVEEYQDTAYPDLGRYLQSQGYHSVFVTAISRELPADDRQEYINFYGVDDWVEYSRLNYEGPRFGWGPAPPDQYALWYMEEELRKTQDQPAFLFYLTQNSHYPWIPQPELAENWRTLNQPAAERTASLPDQVAHSAKRRNYLSAIDYQLRFLADFILKAGHEDAIYVLIGDHQPQQVSRQADGFATPVHIISRDAGFIAALRDYGFADGLVVQDMAPVMRHEGFYSLFVRTLLASYGQGGKMLPAYLPEGMVTELSESGIE